jgi:glucan phosphoethanolaminetransferase (alkaline phosphatase superfamily)
MNPDLQQLLNQLRFRHDALQQLVVVATVLAGFSIGGALTLLTSHHSRRLRPALFGTLTAAALAFMFATILAVILLPHMARTDWTDPVSISGLLGLYRVHVYSVAIGTVLLLVSIGGLGWLVSPRVGTITATLATLTFVGFVLTAYLLNAIVTTSHP